MIDRNYFLKNGRAGDLWILARYLYRIGEEPILSDREYDKLTRLFEEKYREPFKEYLDRTYDDDPIPYALLQEVGLRPYIPVRKDGREELYDVLNEEKSLSINSVTNYRDTYNFVMDKVQQKQDLVASLKMDGVNTKSLYVDGKFSLSLSRGRSSNSFDFTDQVAYVFPSDLENVPHELRVTGESFVLKGGLEPLRQKYKSGKYKTSKSAAISLLRVKHQIEDYKDLHIKVFAAEGLSDTVVGTFERLQSMGFEVVPYLFIPWDIIPQDFEQFCLWLSKEVFDPIYKKQIEQDMPADGLVLEVNDYNWTDVVTNQYSNRQLACKFEHWSFDLYKAVVTEVVVEQRRVNASVRVKIEPMTTNDDCEARIINTFNPSILVSNDIKVGTEVYFERNSGAVNILVHGVRLDQILKG